MSLDNYILGGPDGHTPIREPDLMAWARWFETADRRVAWTDLPNNHGAISTIFLGIDHGFGGQSPILFETMSFLADDNADGYFDRYSTWAEAEAGHARLVAEALAAIANGTQLTTRLFARRSTVEGGAE